ncbi:MAG: 50S ribosomal protein L20 [Candidatus Eremiobacteraeota bacterium]|nr:50S ribosomal protein L20 [Candidatus Eremiobacteraeota bacterium]MCL5054821.1 50S ribosomal protein L20 [Bacillota bacterium]
MARIKRGVIKLKKRRKLFKLTKGYRGARSRRIKTAQEALLHSLQYAFEHRRQKKRDFRRLWNVRINAACRNFGLSYSRFISGLKKQGLILNRKVLSELAVQDELVFKELIELARTAS